MTVYTIFNYAIIIYMAWANKEKTPQEMDEQYILTPDGQNILVGVAEEDILLQSAGFTNWSLKSKVES